MSWDGCSISKVGLFATRRLKSGRPTPTGATPIQAIPIPHRSILTLIGSVVLTTDQEGRYRFKTINPAGYPAGPNRMRPAHIHFQISGRQDRLVTQMYFEGDPYNDTDRFLLTALEQKEMLIAKLLPATSEMEPEAKLVVFDIVLSAG